MTFTRLFASIFFITLLTRLHAQDEPLLINTGMSFGVSHWAGTNSFYINSSSGNTLRTDDKGRSWVLNSHLSAGGLRRQGIYPGDEITSLASTGNGLILRTTDAWHTWDTVFSDPAKSFSSLLTGPDGQIVALFRNTQTFNTTDLLESVDGGLTFTPYSQKPFRGIYEIFFMSQSCALILTADSSYQSSDGGRTWTAIKDWNYFTAQWYLSETDTNTLYLASGRLVMVTPDQGMTWDTLVNLYSAGLLSNSDEIAGAYFNSAGKGIILSASGQLFFSEDGGQTWLAGTGIPFYTSDVFLSLFSLDSLNFVATGTGGQIWHSSDACLSWAQRSGYAGNYNSNNLDGYNTIGAEYVGGNYYYLGTMTSNRPFSSYVVSNRDGSSQTSRKLQIQYGGTVLNPLYMSFTDMGVFSNDTAVFVSNRGHIVTTTDDFDTFQVARPGGSVYLGSVNILPDNKTAFICGDLGSLYKTTDQGLTWADANNTGTTVFFNNYYALSLNKGFLLGDTGFLYKTDDQGTTWTDVSIPDINNLIEASFPDEQTGYIAAEQAIYKTTDGGDTWFKVLEKPGIPFWDVLFHNADTGIVSGVGYYQECNTFITYNGGNSWECFYPLAGIGLANLDLDEQGYLYFAGFYSDVFRVKAPWPTPFTSLPAAPENNFAFNIYPNPAAEIINVDYSLGKPSVFEIEIYSLTGNKLHSIKSGGITANGHLQLSANQLRIHPGAYFIKMRVQSQSYIRKLIVVE